MGAREKTRGPFSDRAIGGGIPTTEDWGRLFCKRRMRRRTGAGTLEQQGFLGGGGGFFRMGFPSWLSIRSNVLFILCISTSVSLEWIQFLSFNRNNLPHRFLPSKCGELILSYFDQRGPNSPVRADRAIRVRRGIGS